VSRLCELYPGIFLTIEEKARRNLRLNRRFYISHCKESKNIKKNGRKVSDFKPMKKEKYGTPGRIKSNLLHL
jgi:hypothetical protein